MVWFPFSSQSNTRTPPCCETPKSPKYPGGDLPRSRVIRHLPSFLTGLNMLSVKERGKLYSLESPGVRTFTPPQREEPAQGFPENKEHGLPGTPMQAPCLLLGGCESPFTFWSLDHGPKPENQKLKRWTRIGQLNVPLALIRTVPIRSGSLFVQRLTIARQNRGTPKTSSLNVNHRLESSTASSPRALVDSRHSSRAHIMDP